MRLAIDNGTKRLEYERAECYACHGTLKVPHFVPCVNYRRPTYGKLCTTPGCNAKRKDDHKYFPAADRVCDRCDGQGTIQETAYSNVPHAVWSALDFVVLPQARAMTWVESFLGIGAAYSCVDYGAHHSLTNDELIAKVRDQNHSGTQALNILADRRDTSDSPLVALMVIATFRDGYKVVALPPALSDDLTESLAAVQP